MQIYIFKVIGNGHHFPIKYHACIILYIKIKISMLVLNIINSQKCNLYRYCKIDNKVFLYLNQFKKQHTLPVF